MNREQRLQKLIELVQNAVNEYVYETSDSEFSALISVSASSGWTNIPEIKEYETDTEDNEEEEE